MSAKHTSVTGTTGELRNVVIAQVAGHDRTVGSDAVVARRTAMFHRRGPRVLGSERPQLVAVGGRADHLDCERPATPRLSTNIAGHVRAAGWTNQNSATEGLHIRPVSRQAIAKHLTVLAEACLVESVRAGREIRYRALGARLSAVAAELESIGRR